MILCCVEKGWKNRSKGASRNPLPCSCCVCSTTIGLSRDCLTAANSAAAAGNVGTHDGAAAARNNVVPHDGATTAGNNVVTLADSARNTRVGPGGEHHVDGLVG